MPDWAKTALHVLVWFIVITSVLGLVAFIRGLFTSGFSGFASVEETLSTGMGNLNETVKNVFGVSEYENFENVEHEE